MAKHLDLSAHKLKYCCGETDPAAVQLEEYRQVYALALYRLNCLDGRTPLTATLLTGVLGSVALLPPLLQLGVLLLLPLNMIWFVGSTIGHARSFEDCLRHIEGVEGALNHHFRRKLIDFQSSHPSGGIVVGGRTGEESVLMVLITSLVLLAACGLTFAALFTPETSELIAYLLYLGVVVACMLRSFRRLLNYQYRKRSSSSLRPDSAQQDPSKWPPTDETCP